MSRAARRPGSWAIRPAPDDGCRIAYLSAAGRAPRCARRRERTPHHLRHVAPRASRRVEARKELRAELRHGRLRDGADGRRGQRPAALVSADRRRPAGARVTRNGRRLVALLPRALRVTGRREPARRAPAAGGRAGPDDGGAPAGRQGGGALTRRDVSSVLSLRLGRDRPTAARAVHRPRAASATRMVAERPTGLVGWPEASRRCWSAESARAHSRAYRVGSIRARPVQASRACRVGAAPAGSRRGRGGESRSFPALTTQCVVDPGMSRRFWLGWRVGRTAWSTGRSYCRPA